MDAAARVRALVAEVADPEIPALTIEDLGILRGVRLDGATVVVEITPTYSGCPALAAIRADVERRLREHGHDEVEVRTVLSPPWTTDLITEQGRRRLTAQGIAPPPPPGAAVPPPAVPCPQCGSAHTEPLSRFGATPCQALRRCRACLEPFPHLRAHR